MASSNIDPVIQKEYSPSMWSKRFPAGEVLPNHISTVTEVSKRIRNCVTFEGVKYGSSSAEAMDIFRPESLCQGCGIFTYVHGGYWQQLSKEDSCYPVEPLIKQGIPVIVPDYELAPSAKLEEIVQQIRRMTEEVVKRANAVNSRGILFGGHSAGAHLLAQTLLTNNGTSSSPLTKKYLRGLVLISGIYNLRPLLKTDINDALELDLDEATRLSPMLDLSKVTNLREDFKVYIFVGENDSPEFKRQSADYAKVLSEKNIKSEFEIIPGLDHFDIVENLQNDDYILTNKIISLITNNY